MQVLFGNSHARAHEISLDEEQQYEIDREAYEEYIEAQADAVLRNQALNQDVIEEAEACIIGGKYEDHQRAAYLALMAGDIDLAKSHAAAGKPVLEREIQGVLSDKTPMSQWRREHRELSYEY